MGCITLNSQLRQIAAELNENPIRISLLAGLSKQLEFTKENIEAELKKQVANDKLAKFQTLKEGVTYGTPANEKNSLIYYSDNDGMLHIDVPTENPVRETIDWLSAQGARHNSDSEGLLGAFNPAWYRPLESLMNSLDNPRLGAKILLNYYYVARVATESSKEALISAIKLFHEYVDYINNQKTENQFNSKIESTQKELDKIAEWSDKHLSFDASSHTYSIDGKPVDTSVTQFVHAGETKEEEAEGVAGFLEIASALGNVHDELGRAFFTGEQLKETYPNMSAYDIASFQKELAALKADLDKRFPDGYKVITDEKYLRLAAAFNDGKTVAGTMDMLVIDSNGDLHIFDFKTKRANKNGTFFKTTLDAYSKQINLYVKMIEAMSPEMTGRVHVGSIVKFDLKYETPRGSRQFETGTTDYISRDGQIYVVANGVETPIQDAKNVKGEAVYSSGKFAGLVETTKVTVPEVNAVTIGQEEVKEKSSNGAKFTLELTEEQKQQLAKENQDQKKKNDSQDSLELPKHTKMGEYQKNGPLAGTDARTGEIKLWDLPKSNPKGFFMDYITGKLSGATSAQKKAVFDKLVNDGVISSIDDLMNILKTTEDIQRFLLWHEQSHKDNNDSSVYYNVEKSKYPNWDKMTPQEKASKRDLMTEDKINIEYRATVDAINKAKKWNEKNTPKQADEPLHIELPKMNIDAFVVSDKEDNPLTKLNHDFDSFQKHNAIEAIATDFLNIVTEETDSEDPNVRKKYIKANIMSIKQSLIDKYTEYLEDKEAQDDDAEDFGEDFVTRKLEYCHKILDGSNLDLLLKDASVVINRTESVVVDFVNNKAEEGTETTTMTDDDSNDEETGKDGWMIKVREVDPRDTLSARVKRIISTTPKSADDVNVMGELAYLSPDFVYAILRNELSDMSYVEDFIKDGKLTALRNPKITKKYPWMNSLIRKLEADPTLVSQFYTDFRKDFIAATSVITVTEEDGEGNSTSKRVTKGLNEAVGKDSAISEITTAFDNDEKYSEHAIYNEGKVVEKNREYQKDQLGQFISMTNDVDFYWEEEDSRKEAFNMLKDMLHSVGINTQDNDLEALYASDDFENDIAELAEALGTIFSKDISADAHLIDFFKGAYDVIAEKVGNVSEAMNVQSFRAGDKTYQSYSAPNYLNTEVKRLTDKNDSRRQAYIDDQFKKFEWFFNHDTNEWRIDILNLLESNPYVREHFKIENMNTIEWGGNTIPYTEWTEEMMQEAFLLQYYSIPNDANSNIQLAKYNLPIFSDSPMCNFITMPKFKGDNYRTEIVGKLVDVAVQELLRMKDVESRKDLDPALKISNYDKTGNKFHFLPRLNSLVNKSELLQMSHAEQRAVLADAISTIMLEGAEEYRNSNLVTAQTLIDNGIIASEEELPEAIDNFYWNHAYATAQIIQLTTTDLAFYKDNGAVDFQKRYKEIYAAGNKLNTKSKYGRDKERVVYLKDDEENSNVLDDIKSVLAQANKEGRISDIDVKAITKAFEGVNVADAQAYRSMSSMRAVLDMMGQWTPEMERAITKMQRNEWTMKDFMTIWQTLKPFVFTQITDTTPGAIGARKVPHQNKNSEFLLLAMASVFKHTAMGQSEKLRALDKWMEDNKIDVVMFESAVKAGGQSVIDLNNVNSFNDVTNRLNESVEKYPTSVKEFDYEDYVIQQPTPEHLIDHHGKFGSQFRNLILSDLSADAIFDLPGGKEEGYTKEEILHEYQSTIVENLLEDYRKVKGRFATIEDLQKALIDTIKDNPKYGPDMIDALQIKDGAFNIPLYNPSTTEKLQELINSFFKNQLTIQKINGGNAILVSCFGLDELKCEYSTDKNGKKHLVGVHCYMPAYSKKFFEPFLKKDGKVEYIDYEMMKEQAPDLLKAIGYRIPTEGKYSMMPLIIDGFLPESNGSAIMLPADITVHAGSDYDVDKAYLMLPESEVVKENGKTVVKKIEYDYSKSPAENTRAQRNNHLIDIAFSALTNADTVDKFVSPGSFDKLKKAAKMSEILDNPDYIDTAINILADRGINVGLEDGLEKILHSLTVKEMDKILSSNGKDPLSPSTFYYFHKQNMTGGALIGMYANNTTLFAKFQAKNQDNPTMQLNYSVTMNGSRYYRLDSIYSPNGDIISKNCAEFSAASVDNVKDPVLAKLMQSTDTANITALMLRMGMSIEEIGLLFTQPYVKSWIEEGMPSGEKLNPQKPSPLEEFIINSPLAESANLNEAEDSFLNTDYTTRMLMELKYNEATGNNADTEHTTNTAKVLFLMDRLKRSSDQLNKLTKIARADSPNGAMATSIAGNIVQKQRVQALREASARKDWTIKGVNVYDVRITSEMNEDSLREHIMKSPYPMLQAFYSLGIDFGQSLMENYFIQYKQPVMDAVEDLRKESKSDTLSEKTLNKFFQDFVKYQLSGLEMFGGDNFNTKRDFYLSQFPARFMDFKKSHPEYAKIGIIRAIKQNDRGELIFERSARLTPAMKESFMRDFDSLLYREDEATARQLALDLFAYAYYKDGFYFGPNSYGSFFSTHFLNSIPEFVEGLKNMDVYDVDNFTKQFLLNTVGTEYSPLKNMPARDAKIDLSNMSVDIPFNNSTKNPVTKKPYKYMSLNTMVQTQWGVDTISYLAELKDYSSDGARYTLYAKPNSALSVKQADGNGKLVSTSPRYSKSITSLDEFSKFQHDNRMIKAFYEASNENPYLNDDVDEVTPDTPTSEADKAPAKYSADSNNNKEDFCK